MIKTLHQALLATGLLVAASIATAAPVTFNFTFDDPNSAAQAVGSITFEDTLLANPGVNDFFLPDPAVLALTVTVSGATNGNGTFGINDFAEVVFDTDGATLDLGSQLVGQVTPDSSVWGTPDGNSGDFNLFSSAPVGNPQGHYSQTNAATGGNPAPNGVFYFTLGANGGNDEEMVLVGMAQPGGGPGPAPANLPIGRNAMLLLAGMLGLVAAFALRRRKHRA